MISCSSGIGRETPRWHVLHVTSTWLAFLAHVTEWTAHAKRAGEVAHHADDLHDGRAFRNDFDADERVGREVAGRLGENDGRGGKGGNEKGNGAWVHGVRNTPRSRAPL